MSDETQLHATAERIRGLIYSWVYSGGDKQSPMTNPVLLTVSLMENGPSTFRIDTPEPATDSVLTLVPYALAIGTAPSVNLLASYLIGVYMATRTPEQFLAVAAVANLSYYGVNTDPTTSGILNVLSLVTRNVLTLCKHFIGDAALHEYLRLVSNDLQYIPANHPFAVPALCYWALREVARECVRWDVDRGTAFPAVRTYMTSAINRISSHNNDTDTLRTVFSVLSCWLGIGDVAGPITTTSVVNTVEYHVLWHRICSVNY